MLNHDVHQDHSRSHMSPSLATRYDTLSISRTGSILWHARHTLRNLLIRFVVRALSLMFPSVDALMKRIRSSPGLPISNPSISYWSIPPSPISRHGTDPGSVLPEYADVVIIGSGITGTSFARTLLDHNADHGNQGQPLQVVMLEARDTCSGATGRWVLDHTLNNAYLIFVLSTLETAAILRLCYMQSTPTSKSSMEWTPRRR
jgi:hypothetical protein